MKRIYTATGAGGGKQKDPPQTQKQTKPKKK